MGKLVSGSTPEEVGNFIGTLYLVPVALSTTSTLRQFLPDYNLEIILKTKNFIVENARTARNFLSSCGKEKIQNLNIQEIAKAGDKFDPTLHEAVMHIEDENFDENVIVEVLQKGYKIGDTVIRAAMVKVAN